MTTPNYPYGEPENNGDANSGSGGGAPDYGSYGSGNPASAGDYSTESPGAGQISNSYPLAGGAGYQDPYNSGYTGGFENSPLNATKNKVAAWALGLGIASVVLYLTIFTGPLAVLVLLAPFIAVAGIIVSIVALVKGKKVDGPGRRTGFSIAGLILSIIGLLIFIFFIVVIMMVLGSGVMDCFNADYPDAAAQQACIQTTLNNL